MTEAKRRGRTHAGVARDVRMATSEDTTQLLEMAFALHQAGELARARGYYERVIEQDPGHADALHFLGLACFQGGDARRAAALIHRAIERKPTVAPYHDNLGSVLESVGEFDEALEAYRKAAQLAGEDPERCFNMGVVLERSGRRAEAEAAYRRAIALAPDDGGFHYNLANLLKTEARLEEALTHYQRAVDLQPGSAEARNNLGNTLQALGRLDDAVRAYCDAIRLRADDAAIHVNLANVHRVQSDLEAAEAGYARALTLDPGRDEARLALGQVQHGLGKFDVALATFEALLERQPDNAEARMGLASVLRFVPLEAYRPALCKHIERCFETAEVQVQDLAAASAQQLRARHRLDDVRGELGAVVAALGDDPLATALLTRTINVDPVLEGFLTRARAHLLLSVDDPAASPAQLRFATALALQCFINEYVFASSPEEKAAVAARQARLERRLAELAMPDESLRADCAVLAMYRPLLQVEGGERLGLWRRDAWGEPLWALIERSVCEPLEERALAGDIDTVGDIEDATSAAVRAQYEEHPYPRWLELPRRTPLGYRDYLCNRFPRFTPPAFLSDDVEVLAAGCGTGQEAIAIAAARSPCRVLGLDLSRRSLAYARRMAAKLGVGNVRFVHGDILDLGRLGRRFHVIESTGVLHHMADPLAGWRALRDGLEPGGLMRIGLYSERARADVVRAREQIGKESLSPVDADIRAFRARVLSAPDGAPLAALAESEDLYTMSACRDLLFHTEEHRFTLPAVAAALDALQLRFIGFDPAVPGVLHDYAKFNPTDTDLTDLSAWARFEESRPELFAALYVFWCQKPS